MELLEGMPRYDDEEDEEDEEEKDDDEEDEEEGYNIPRRMRRL